MVPFRPSLLWTGGEYDKNEHIKYSDRESHGHSFSHLLVLSGDDYLRGHILVANSQSAEVHTARHGSAVGVLAVPGHGMRADVHPSLDKGPHAASRYVVD